MAEQTVIVAPSYKERIITLMQTVPELTYVQQTILDCVLNFDGQLQRSEIAKLLHGSDSGRIAGLHGDRYFGRLARITRKSLMHHVDVLLQQQYLEQDGFDRVLLAERGRAFFTNRQ
jgi:hypothetical protein